MRSKEKEKKEKRNGEGKGKERDHVKWDSVLWRNLSERERVGASVTNACRLVCTVQE